MVLVKAIRSPGNMTGVSASHIMRVTLAALRGQPSPSASHAPATSGAAPVRHFLCSPDATMSRKSKTLRLTAISSVIAL
jgi:hypothetical protein